MHGVALILITFIITGLPSRVACQWADTAAIPYLEGGRWGLYSPAGLRITPPTFRDMGAYHNGLAPARHQGRWGYVNPRGQWVIPPVYDYTSAFSNGTGWVWHDSIPTAIHPSGLPLAVQPNYPETSDWGLDIEPNQPPLGYNLFADGRTGHITLYDSTRRVFIPADSGYVLGVHPHRLAPGVWVTYSVFGHPVFLDAQFREICRLPAQTENELWGWHSPQKINSDIMESECLYRGHFISRNPMQIDPAKIPIENPNGLGISISPTVDTLFQDRYLARRVWITNTSDDTFLFDDMRTSTLGFVLQAIGTDGAWHNITHPGIGMCCEPWGCVKSLYPHTAWQIALPEFEGEFQTRLRVVHLPYIPVENRFHLRNNGTPAPGAISPEWRGSINPGQFWRQEDSRWHRIRFPYWN